MSQPRIKRDGAGTLWLVLDAPRLSIALTAEQAVQIAVDVAQAGVGVAVTLDGSEPTQQAGPTSAAAVDNLEPTT